jgi:hypothetical protein
MSLHCLFRWILYWCTLLIIILTDIASCSVELFQALVVDIVEFFLVFVNSPICRIVETIDGLSSCRMPSNWNQGE